jgi:nitrite reductase/ring-hydroxylating ferredoxin subunit
MTAGHARVPDPGGRVYRSQYQDDPYQGGGQLSGGRDGYGFEEDLYEPPAEWGNRSGRSARRDRTLPSGRRVARRPEPEEERPSWRERLGDDGGDGTGRRKLLIGGAVGGVLALVGERLLGLFGKALQSTANAGTGNQASGGGGQQQGSVVLGSTGDIPVGGGKIYTAHKVVVTQPTAGVFQGFSTTCTHAGCQVNQVQQGKILCPCHGGQFSVADGSVVGGPPPKALPAAAVAVQGTNVVLTS